jgi:hypothetical protein
MRLKSRRVWQFSHDYEAKVRDGINSKGLRPGQKPLSRPRERTVMRREIPRLRVPALRAKAKARDTPLGMTRNAFARRER